MGEIELMLLDSALEAEETAKDQYMYYMGEHCRCFLFMSIPALPLMIGNHASATLSSTN